MCIKKQLTPRNHSESKNSNNKLFNFFKLKF